MGLEMIFDDVEESAGPRFRATLHDLGRCNVVAGETLRILVGHQLFLKRVRQEDEPLVEFRSFRRSKLGSESGIGMLIDKMKHDRRSFRNNKRTILKDWNATIRI